MYFSGGGKNLRIRNVSGTRMAGRRCDGHYHKLRIQDGKFMKIELNCSSFEEMPVGRKGDAKEEERDGGKRREGGGWAKRNSNGKDEPSSRTDSSMKMMQISVTYNSQYF